MSVLIEIRKSLPIFKEDSLPKPSCLSPHFKEDSTICLKFGKEEMALSEKQIVAIVVDERRNDEVSNGLMDLKRDILMRLIRILHDEKKIRNVFFTV
jgi:hypothetical protein